VENVKRKNLACYLNEQINIAEVRGEEALEVVEQKLTGHRLLTTMLCLAKRKDLIDYKNGEVM
jgi:type IV secretory pathway ATPase VirB11/archaellum biosynthesis ATPase